MHKKITQKTCCKTYTFCKFLLYPKKLHVYRVFAAFCAGKPRCSGEKGIHMNIEKKILRIQMFGGFSMYYGNDAVLLNKSGNSKSIRLLQMLLLSMKGGIPKRELMDNLYEWNENADTANRNKNLNNLIYRLQGQLVSGGLPDDE